MLKKLYSAALCALALTASSQPFTGQDLYPHTTSTAFLSSGKPCLLASNSNAGFVMAGYIPSICCPGDIIYIDKVDSDGSAGGPNWFQNSYGCKTGGTSCVAAINDELDCYGVSIVETNIPASLLPPIVPTTCWYAIAAAFNSGVIFAGLDNTGAVSTTGFLPFPVGATQPTKPLIYESSYNANTYYVVGSFFAGNIRYMYVARVDAAGTVLWSQNYDLSNNSAMTPKGIIESPPAYTGAIPHLIVVGYYNTASSTVNDAFYMDIDDSSNGLVFTMNSYGIATTIDEFHSIALAPQVLGYIVGGYTSANPAAGQSWMALIDQANPSNFAAPYWSKHVRSTDPNAGPIVSVLERVSAFYGAAEYYGATSTVNGMTVEKLDGNGDPFTAGGSNEFNYDISMAVVGSPAVPVEMSYLNTALATREGIHVYGYDWLAGTANTNYMLVRACFDGLAATAGCFQTPATVNPANLNGPVWGGNMTPGNTSGLTNCQFFSFWENLASYSPSNYCYAVTAPPGSNNRSAATGLAKNTVAKAGFRVQPNPASDKVEISYPASDAVNITLYNSMGQLVQRWNNDANSQSLTVNLAELNLAGGVYFVQAEANGEVYRQKLIYNK